MSRLNAKLVLLLLSCMLIAACSPAPQSGTPAGADFILKGPNGTVDSKNYRGKLMLVFFGYVHCPCLLYTSDAADE